MVKPFGEISTPSWGILYVSDDSANYMIVHGDVIFQPPPGEFSMFQYLGFAVFSDSLPEFQPPPGEFSMFLFPPVRQVTTRFGRFQPPPGEFSMFLTP